MPKSRRRKKSAVPTSPFANVPPRAQELLAKQLENFRRKFGRDPGPDDPLFFDPREAEPTPLPDVAHHILDAMHKANLPPEFAYAFRRTGLLGLGKDKSAWDPADIAEWNAAIDEYHAIQKAKKRPDFPVLGTWNTEIPELLLSSFSRDDLARVSACLKALDEFETGMKMITRIELAAAVMALALEHAYQAGEETGQPGDGVETFEAIGDLINQRAREIYAQGRN